ncbi:BrnT family toxin [Paraburkholderia bannensis]|nr:BrnT family toxin [Paraburkholderia bannensis]RQM44736.1 BrnT family toxin [Paraburkholderia bannensis]
MDITFDNAKNVSNIAKHGVALAFANRIDWSEVLVLIDDRADYGEVREIGYAVIDNRLYCVVFTQRGKAMHVISLRKANRREVKRYAEEA